MLADSVLQTLRRSTHVPTFAVAHVFIYDVTLLKTSQERKQPECPGKLANSIPHCDSAIGNHLLHNQSSHYKDNQFFILSKTRFDFHLSVLESIFITLRKPNLCRQKEFVYKHKLLV